MRDFSLHILDIAENSVRAGATCVEISVHENSRIRFSVKDNGSGMDDEIAMKAQDPFFTMKTERKKKFGLGIPLLKQNVEMAGGAFRLESKQGIGTLLEWEIDAANIDALPMGKLSDTMWMLTVFYPQSEFRFMHSLKDREVSIKSSEIREIFNGMDISSPEISDAVKMYIYEKENSLKSGGIQ